MAALTSSVGRGCAFLRSPQLLRQRLTARLARTQEPGEASQHVRWLLQDGDYGPLDGRAARRRLIADVARLAQGEPLAYVLGTQPFAGLLLKCRAPTLIPRPETEEWGLRVADLARSWLATLPERERGIRVLDLCTGSG
jgi:methylase of polypeptide subunit release factors